MKLVTVWDLMIILKHNVSLCQERNRLNERGAQKLC